MYTFKRNQYSFYKFLRNFNIISNAIQYKWINFITCALIFIIFLFYNFDISKINSYNNIIFFDTSTKVNFVYESLLKSNIFYEFFLLKKNAPYEFFIVEISILNNIKAATYISLFEIFFIFIFLIFIVFIIFYSTYSINNNKNFLIICQFILNNIIIIYFLLLLSYVNLQLSDNVFNYHFGNYTFYQSYNYTKSQNFFKIIIVFINIIFLYVLKNFVKKKNIKNFEFILFLPFISFGIIFLLNSNDFIIFYIATEILALSLYSWIGTFRESKFATEAAIKYFIMGSFSSGLLIFGISFIYGFTGSLNFFDINVYLNYFCSFFTINKNDIVPIFYNLNEKIFIFSIILILVAFIFKVGAAPFHLWVADVYGGSSLIVTMFLSIIPKLVYSFIIMKLFLSLFLNYLTVLEFLFLGVGLSSMLLGLMGAFYQIKFKRLIAYSAIFNGGLIFLGILSANEFVVVLFLIIYSILLLNVFITLIFLWNKETNSPLNKITNFSNLINNNLIISIVIGFSLLSMAGLPPLIGFFSKFIILNNLFYNNYLLSGILFGLLSIIGSFYYLRLLKIIFFDKNSFFILILNSDFILAFLIAFTFLLNIFSIFFITKFNNIILYLIF